MNRFRFVGFVASFTASLTLAAPAFAQTPAQPAPAAAGSPESHMSFGIRGGFSAVPNQGFVGAQVESPRLGLTQHTSLRPDVEVGFGGNAGTVFTVAVNAVAWLPFPNSPWSAYVGGGPMLVHAGIFAGSADVVVGVQNRKGLFFEIKASGGQAPNLKGTVGLVLKHQ